MQLEGAGDVPPRVHGKRRFGIIFVLTVLVVSAAIGYMVERGRRWHERGWTGVSYIAGANALNQAKLVGLEEFEVMMTVAGTEADGPIHYRDRILAINGVRVDDKAGMAKLNATLRRGDTVVYRLRRGDRVLEVPLRLVSPLRSAYVLTRHAVAVTVALAFIAIGLLVIARARDPRANVFYAMSLITAVALIGQCATLYEQSNARGVIQDSAWALASLMILACLTYMFAPLILHLSLVFPRPRPILERRPYLLGSIYALAALLALSLAFTGRLLWVMAQDIPVRANRQVSAIATPVFFTMMVLAAGLLVHLLYAARKEGAAEAIARRPFRSTVALIGLLIGFGRLAGMAGIGFMAGFLTATAMVVPMIVVMSFPFLAFVAFYRSYRTANVEEKRQVVWPLWGLLITIGIKILTYVAMFGLMGYLAVTRRDLIPWRGTLEILQLIPLVVTVLVPLSFAAAIFKYRLMNIDVIIRKTVVYAILSTLIVVVYLGVVGGLGTLLISYAGVQNQTMVVASTLVVALLFVPMRNKLQTLVDRNLFRHKYDYPEALRGMANDARTATDTHAFLGPAAEKIQQALQNRSIVIFVERQDEFAAAAKVGVSDALLGRLRVPHSFGELLDRPFDPRRRTLPGDTAAALARIDTVLVVPAGNRAFIAAAPKLAGGELDVEDIDFLRTAGDQVAMAVDRIRMQAEDADYAQARAIQQTLLPREMPRVAKLDLSGVWQPARTMGGDYYDLLELSDSELAVCIGDVAGKGMPAALLMSGLQAAVRASASNSPRDLCERVRRVVVSSLSGGRFVTFFYATVDTAAMKLRWCNAGHNAPVLARADGSVVRLVHGGPAFSRLFRDSYEEREIALLPGDRLVLFTDGVSEAADGAGEQFGEERIEALAVSNTALGAEALQKTIVDAALAFSGGEHEDDVTLVVVAVGG